MKQILCAITVLCVILFALGGAAASQADTQAPVIVSCTVSNTAPAVNSTVTITVGITDNQDLASASCMLLSGGQLVTQQPLIYNAGTEGYECTFLVSAAIWSGPYDIAVYAYDGNWNHTSRIFPDVLTIDNPNEDREPPVLVGCTLSSDEVTVPGSIDIAVEVDDPSGVAYVDGYYNPVGVDIETDSETGAYTWRMQDYVCFSYNDATGLWEATMEFDQYDWAGEHECAFLIGDNAGNMAVPENSFTFTVVNPDEDREFPVISSFALSTDTVTAPGTAELSAAMTDNGKVFGLSYSLELDGQSDGYLQMGFDAESGLYRCSIPISETLHEGVYDIWLTAIDYSGNTTDMFYPQALTVVNPAAQNIAPVITGFTAFPAEIAVPGMVTISAEVSAAAALDYAKAELVSGGETLHFAQLYPAGGNLLLARYYLDESYENGSYGISVEIADVDGNHIRQDYPALFTVNGGQEPAPQDD